MKIKILRRKTKVPASLALIMLLAFAVSLSNPTPTNAVRHEQESQTTLTNKEYQIEVTSKMAKVRIPFIANEGQMNEQVKFYVQTYGGTVFVTKEGKIVYDFPFRDCETGQGNRHDDLFAQTEKKENLAAKGVALYEELVQGTVHCVTGEKEAVTTVNYFKGNDRSKWKSNIPTFEMVDLGEVYEGIELKLKAYGNNVEKLFYVQPGAEMETIKLKLSGANRLAINEAGKLEIKTGHGIVLFTKPTAYQEQDGEKQYVEVAYTVCDNEYGFAIGEYDRTKELIIDPLIASTFLGDSGHDEGYSLVLEKNDDGDVIGVYVAGATKSSNFPTTSGAYDRSYNGGSEFDVFVVKLNGNLSSLSAATFLGGSSYEYGYALALDSSGNVFVACYTNSSNFPTTSGAYDTSSNGGRDVFVSKLSGDLTQLSASTYLGGSSDDFAYALDLDPSGNVYVVGRTDSSNFPKTTGAYDESHNGSWDVFISKLNNNLTSLSASTFLGSSGEDRGYFIVLDSSSNVYVTGLTASSGFPYISGAYDTSFNGGRDVFVSKLNSSLSSLSASTFLGGNSDDVGQSLALDSNGNVYVTGYTASAGFPTTTDAYDKIHNGGDDGFISKLSSDLTTLSASTFLGGSSNDYIESHRSITLCSPDNVYVTGLTSSSDFPVTSGAYDEYYNYGPYDAFLSILNSNLTSLSSSTFLGGSGDDRGYSLVLDTYRNVYMTGLASSGFPYTSDAYDITYNGSGDTYVLKLTPYEDSYEDCICSVTDHYTVTDNGDNTCTVVFQPNAAYGKDTYLAKWGSDTNNNCGAAGGPGYFSGYHPSPYEFTGLIKFNLDVIPSNAEIVSSEFSFYCDADWGNAWDYRMARVTRNWAEGVKDCADCSQGATWATYDCSNNWTNAGGDYSSPYSPYVSTPGLDQNCDRWLTWDVLDLTTVIVDGTYPNYGWIMIPKPGASSQTCVYGYFSEYGTASLRPKLTVTYRKRLK